MPGYSPPLGNAVNFAFAGAYTPPLGGAVNPNFVNINAYVLTAAPGTYVLAGAAMSPKAARHLFAYDQLIPGLAAGGITFIDLSGWTVSGLTLTLINGAADLVDASSGGGVAYRAIAVNPGQQYVLEGHLIDVTASMGMAVGTTPGGQQLGSVLSFANGIIFTVNPVTHPNKQIVFTAPSSGVVYVSMFLGAAGHGTAQYLRMEQAGRYQLSGADATLTAAGRILPMGGGTYAIAGSPASLKVGRRLPAEPGVYIQTRATAQLHAGRLIAAGSGSYTINPSDASITEIVGRYIHAERGAYGLVGSDVRLLVGRRMPMGGGTYALVGGDLTTVYRRTIKAAPATYALAGAAAGLKVGYRLPATPGSYTLVGADLGLVNRRLVADSGSYAVAGADARLLVGKVLTATPGVYTATGAATALLLHRRLVAAAGAYAIAPTNVALRVGRRLAAASGAYVIAGAVARVARDYTIQATPGVYTLSGTALRPIITRRMSLAGRDFHLAWPDVGLVPTWRPRGPRAIAVGFAASRYLAVSSQNRRVAVGRQDRRIAVEPAAQRYAAVEPRDKEPMGGSMLQWPEKDPNEVLDYQLDWADPNDPRLETGETLLTSVWSVVLGDVVIDAILTNFTAQGLSTVWLSGGTPTTKCELLNRVTTSKGRTYDKSVVLRVRDH